MFGLVLAFVHWGSIHVFHCIVIEHILECLVWWHSMSYVGYYFTLGHTPILESTRSFAYFLTTQSISWSLRVVTLGHTLFSAFLLGHTPSLWVYRVSCWFHGYQTHLLIFMSYYLGHPPIVISFGASPVISFGASPHCHFTWGIPLLLLSFRLGHPPTVIFFRASPYFHFV